MEHYNPIPSCGNDKQWSQDIKSGDMIVVYKASLSSAAKVIELLRKEGLDAAALDQPNMVLAHRTPNTMYVRIVVPRAQAASAESILKQWEQGCTESVAGLTGQLKSNALYSCIITALIALALFVSGHLTAESSMLLAGVWVAVFALLANSEKISRYFKKG